METNTYKTANRKRLRFPSTKGSLAVEDLFQLSLTDLDAIYVSLLPAVATQGQGLMRRKSDIDLDLRLAIIKDVFETKQAENEAVAARETAKAQKLRILQLIEQKKDENLAEKSVEELTALVNQLGD